MKRHGATWIVFGLSAALLFAAVGWVSVTVLRLESAQWDAGFVADREEKIRLALWRLDSTLAPLMVEESSRPALAYRPFQSATRAYSRAFTALQPGEVLVPSPLLGVLPPHVLLHFQLDAANRLTSPQVPEGNERDLAETGYTTHDRIAAAAAQLARLQTLLDAPNPGSGPDPVAANGEVLRRTSRLPEPDPVPPPENVALPLSNRYVPAENVQMQALLNAGERQARGNFSRLSQQGPSTALPAPQPPLALSPEPAPAPALPSASPPRAGRLRAVWLDDTLLLTRGAVLPDGPVVQGCWLDWTALSRSLLASIQDLLPETRLEPLRESARAEDPRALASLPIRLVPAPGTPPPIPRITPIRLSLAVSWAAVLLAALAVAFLLRAALDLGERRGAFVSAVTHELRSPLTTFRLYSEMLAEGMVPDEPTRQAYLETLCAESNRLGHLVENVLAFAGLERGSARRHPEFLGLADLLRRVSPRLLQRARQAGLELALTPPAPDTPPGPTLHVDVSAVEQVLFNLVDNACKYAAPTASQPVIHLEAATDGRFAVLRVRDHGPGIPPNRTRRLFRPFNKSAHEAAQSAPGIGLGLALSRRLSRSLGGDLRLETRPGQGAAFELRLPLQAGPVPPAAAAPLALLFGAALLAAPSRPEASDWPQFQHDARRTGATPDTVAPPYRIRWCWLGPDLTIRNRLNTGNDADPELRPGDILATRTRLPATVPFAFSGLAQPVIHGGRVLLGDVDGQIYALDADRGTTLWVRPLPGGTFTAGAVLDGAVVFASLTGTVRAFDPASGDCLWEHTGFGSFLAAPAAGSHLVCVASTDRHVRAFDREGRLRWTSPDLGAPIAGGLALDDTAAYVGTENLRFHRLALADGRLLNQTRVAGQSFAAQWPVVHDGRVYVEASPIPAIGSEYVGEDLMNAATDVHDEMQRWRAFLRGEGGYRDASPDWKHLTVLDAGTFREPYLVPAGPFDGCGQPPDPPAVDTRGRVWTYFKSRWHFLARPCGFGTKHHVDLGVIDPATGDRVVVDHGRTADNAWYAWETDNLYALSFTGPTLLLRQSFRGTVALDTDTAQARAVSNLYHSRDGGTWTGDIQYADNFERGDRVPRASRRVPYARPPVATSAPCLYLVEDFCLTAVEHHP